MKTYTVTVDNREVCGQVIRWYKEGTITLHCEHGPAIIWTSGYKSYYIEGQRHNEHGPAIILADGEKYWWLDNKHYFKQEFDKEMKRRNNFCDGTTIEIKGKKYKLTGI